MTPISLYLNLAPSQTDRVVQTETRKTGKANGRNREERQRAKGRGKTEGQQRGETGERDGGKETDGRMQRGKILERKATCRLHRKTQANYNTKPHVRQPGTPP
jgi:hypothetical protein